MFMPTDDMIGDAIARFETNGTVTVKRDSRHGPDGYRASTPHDTLVGGILNVAGAASALTPDSTLEFGGDRRKRVTVTETPTGDNYLYVEVA